MDQSVDLIENKCPKAGPDPNHGSGNRCDKDRSEHKQDGDPNYRDYIAQCNPDGFTPWP